MRADAWLLGASLGVFTCSIGNLALHYLRAQSALGGYPWHWLINFTPTWQQHMQAHPDSWFYKWLWALAAPRATPFFHEQWLFSGFLLLAIPVAGLWLAGRRPPGGARAQWRIAPRSTLCYALSTWLILVLLSLRVSDFSAWKLVVALVPAASAVRAIGRIETFLLIPLCVAAAVSLAMLAELPRRWAGVMACVMSLLLMLENGATWTTVYAAEAHLGRVARVRSLLQQQTRRCKTFYYLGAGPVIEDNIDAMWVSMETGVPTANGYSGNAPPAYRDLGLFEATTVHEVQISKWYQIHGVALDPADVCLLQL